MNLVANPINALANANYIGILAWALVLGAALRHHGSDTTRQVAADLADTVSTVVKWIIRLRRWVFSAWYLLPLRKPV